MYGHQYDKWRAARLQDGVEEMIRMRQPTSSGPHPDPLRDLQSAASAMLTALKKIAEGRGRFSTDQLTFAANTIDDMKELANEAIAQAEAAGIKELRSSLNTTEKA